MDGLTGCSCLPWGQIMDEQAVYKNRRISMLSLVAFITVITILGISAWKSDSMDDGVKAIVTLILGRFLGYTDQVYAYDFNTTRSSTTKDATIATLSTTAADSNLLNKEQK